MCGIFSSIGNHSDINSKTLNDCFNLISHRGPDNTTWKQITNFVGMGFHRLAIVCPEPNSNQPLKLNSTWLICNGEIFNHKFLEETYDLTDDLKTGSDCEIILHLYKLFKGGRNAIHNICTLIEAEFSFILYDEVLNECFCARDIFGVRPLFWGIDSKHNLFFSSEIKSLKFLDAVEPFLPGHYMEIRLNSISILNKYKLFKYYDFPNRNNKNYFEFDSLNIINKLLRDAVNKRLMSDRPVGCFLSGGVDSSIISSLVSEKLPNVECFSIGLKNGVDICSAKKVVSFLNNKGRKIKHHIVNFTIEEGFLNLRNVIYHLETYDVTTIRASTPQYLLSKYIKNNTNIVVSYIREGADEAFNSYLYSRYAPSAYSLEIDSKRLLSELYLFDNLRVDRTTSAFGLEVRIPFLDPKILNYLFSLSPEFRVCNNNIIEKKILRDAFKKDNIIPNEILYRQKSAFSDAVSSKDESWYKTLCAKFINNVIKDEELQNAYKKYPFNTPRTKEALYYRNIFSELFPNRDRIIPHYWMPKWVDVEDDPSATILPNVSL